MRLGARGVRDTVRARGDGTRAGAGIGSDATVVVGGGKSPLRQALNNRSMQANSSCTASQSSRISHTAPPACRTRATRVLRWPDAMGARGIIAMDVVLYNDWTDGKEKMLVVWIFRRACLAP